MDKTSRSPQHTPKKGVPLPRTKTGNLPKPAPRPGKEAHYRSVAVRIPGNSSLMVVHVKEY